MEQVKTATPPLPAAGPYSLKAQRPELRLAHSRSSMHSSNDPRNQVIDSGDMSEQWVDGKSGLCARGLQRQATTLTNPPA